MKRYTQYLLFNNDSILLIANANSNDKGAFLEKGLANSVFTLAPFDATSRWNRNKPLLNSFFTYLAILFSLIALILILEINITEDMIDFKFDLSWENISLKNLLQ